MDQRKLEFIWTRPQERKWLPKTGGQVVMQVLSLRWGAAAGGTIYSAKKWGGNCPPSPTPINMSLIMCTL